MPITAMITTVAGSGAFGFSGDGGPATSASLRSPSGVAVDGSGNVLIADQDNHRIRRVASGTGIITTIAGYGGHRGNIGDGGPATSAQLYSPSKVVVDSIGNLLIADTGNNKVRRVDTSGNITTVAGKGDYDFSGDGGPATRATFRNLTGVAVDSIGNLFIADQQNNRIRRVDAGTGIITAVAGTGTYAAFDGDGGPATSARLSNPTDVAVDSIGNLLIADTGNNRVRRVDTSGIITTVAGTGTGGFSGDGGAGTSAALFSPSRVAVDGGGNVFIVDFGNQRIRRVAASTGIITTLAGNGEAGYSGDGGPATSAALKSPTGLALDTGGNLLIADTGNNRIRKVNGPFT